MRRGGALVLLQRLVDLADGVQLGGEGVEVADAGGLRRATVN